MASRSVKLCGLLLILFCIDFRLSRAQTWKKETIQFNISSNEKIDSLELWFLRDFIFGQKGIVAIKLNKDNTSGRFTFLLNDVNHPGQASFVIYQNGSSYKLNQSDYFVEPGDSISIFLRKKNGQTTVIFNGKRQGNYKLQSELHQAQNKFRENWSNTVRGTETAKYYRKLFTIVSNAIKIGRKISDKYKSKVNVQMRQLIFEEHSANLRNQWEVVMGYFFKTEASHPKDTLQRSYFDLQFYRDSIQNPYATYSPAYVKNIVEQIQTTVLLSGKPNIGFADVYERIKQRTSGIIRQKALTYFLLDYSSQKYLTAFIPMEFESCLKDAYQLVTSVPHRRSLSERFVVIKGAQVFPFSLSDTAGNLVQLKDFRGKVLLIDFWSEGCSGCVIFSRKFESEILPGIKNDQFQIISINTNTSRDRWMANLYTGKYTKPHYINLHAPYDPQTQRQHPFLEYYDIDALPFIFLVSKDGKMYSLITISMNSAEILNLIKQALNEI